MSWILQLGLALLALVPLAWVLWRPRAPRERGEADLALYRAQIAELDRERDAGRLDSGAHGAAMVEVQRRLLAAPRVSAPVVRPARLGRLLPVLIPLLPAAAFGLYLWHGRPGLPDAPLQERQAEARADEAVMATLRQRLAQMPPGSEALRQGLVLLGGAERGRGNAAAAAEAWGRALAIRYDPALAADLIELQIERGQAEPAMALLTQALAVAPDQPRLRFLAGLAAARNGRVEAARETWTALLADAPADAPWKPLVERALAGLP